MCSKMDLSDSSIEKTVRYCEEYISLILSNETEQS